MNILPIRIIIYGICYFFPINFSHMYQIYTHQISVADPDPGSGMETVRIQDGKKSDPGSGINIPDPQHCIRCKALSVQYYTKSLLKPFTLQRFGLMRPANEMARRWDGGQWKMRVSAASDDDCARLWAALGKRFAQPPLVGQRIETLNLRNGDPEQKGGNQHFHWVLQIRIRDPVFWPLDPGSGSGMNISDYFSEILETVFRIKNT